MPKKKDKEETDKAIDRLADLLDYGHLLASTSGADLLNAASDEIERLRASHTELRQRP